MLAYETVRKGIFDEIRKVKCFLNKETGKLKTNKLKFHLKEKHYNVLKSMNDRNKLHYTRKNGLKTMTRLFVVKKLLFISP